MSTDRDLCGATAQMLLDEKEFDYVQFKCDFKAAYLSVGREGKKTELVKLTGYEKHEIKENFPIATFCYLRSRTLCGVKKPENFYDIFCPDVHSAILDLPTGKKVYGIYVRDLKALSSSSSYRLFGKFCNYNYLEQSVKPCTMNDFLEKKMKDGKVDCWVIPDDVARDWKILPCYRLPPPPKNFLPLWNRMKAYTYSDENFDFFGIVVLPGKLLIQRILVDCPLDYKVGTTWMCQIRDTAISTSYKTHILTKSVPFTIDPDLIEIYVDDDAKLLIKTVVGPMAIPYLKPAIIAAIETENRKNPNGEYVFDERQGKYNVVMHPFFGKIILPRNLVWSADATMVIFSYLFSAQDAVNSLGRGIPFALAVHDGFNMVRLPLHMKTTASAVKLIIKHGMQLKEGVVDEREIEADFLPFLPLKGYRVDGAVLSLHYCKPFEDDEKQLSTNEEKFGQSDFVKHHYQQQQQS